ncbi:hypothetical protein B0F90DRAFT_472929 [Multifurca ochricompacta]|uniref:Uncharacterized protein n=1 Tax=Multifurca ochricompacta TaxID=376703 RepID=A0AAD4MD06_9AGAM|nr:hypothetical protein B0F90DRAFT_472929 [Multifurca ochricompacta]
MPVDWTLTALDEDKEIEDFAARVPGFFDSRAVPDAPSAILSLMETPQDQPTSDPILGSRLGDLLKTWISGTSPLPEESRRNRLRVCLRCPWYCGRAYIRSENLVTLPSYVCAVFASSEMTRHIQTEDDVAARIIGRCFGSLVVKILLNDVNARIGVGLRINEGELHACLLFLARQAAR